MLNRLITVANAKNLYRIFFITLLAMLGMNILGTAFYQSTGGNGMLDLAGGANLITARTSYTPDDAYALIESYGQEGIIIHLAITALDMVFPAILGTFLMLATTYFASHIMGMQATRWLLILPMLYILSDYLENVGIVMMLVRYPATLPDVAAFSNIMMMVKNTSSTLTLILIALGLLITLSRHSYRSLKHA